MWIDFFSYKEVEINDSVFWFFILYWEIFFVLISFLLYNICFLVVNEFVVFFLSEEFLKFFGDFSYLIRMCMVLVVIVLFVRYILDGCVVFVFCEY